MLDATLPDTMFQSNILYTLSLTMWVVYCIQKDLCLLFIYCFSLHDSTFHSGRQCSTFYISPSTHPNINIYRTVTDTLFAEEPVIHSIQPENIKNSHNLSNSISFHLLSTRSPQICEISPGRKPLVVPHHVAPFTATAMCETADNVRSSEEFRHPCKCLSWSSVGILGQASTKYGLYRVIGIVGYSLRRLVPFFMCVPGSSVEEMPTRTKPRGQQHTALGDALRSEQLV